MIYDLRNDYDVERFRTRTAALIKRRVVVELIERKPTRTLPQNNYLHTILGCFGAEVGETIDYVKTHYFKRLCNKDIFVRTLTDKYAGEIEYLRSTAELDTQEMSTAIERFRNWTAKNGIYLPGPNDDYFLLEAQKIINQHKLYL